MIELLQQQNLDCICIDGKSPNFIIFTMLTCQYIKYHTHDPINGCVPHVVMYLDGVCILYLQQICLKNLNYRIKSEAITFSLNLICFSAYAFGSSFASFLRTRTTWLHKIWNAIKLLTTLFDVGADKIPLLFRRRQVLFQRHRISRNHLSRNGIFFAYPLSRLRAWCWREESRKKWIGFTINMMLSSIHRPSYLPKQIRFHCIQSVNLDLRFEFEYKKDNQENLVSVFNRWIIRLCYFFCSSLCR